jgi:transposase-like protein
MAWPKETKNDVRRCYIFDQISLENIAKKFGIHYDTVCRWKRAAAKEGDDWDALRVAHTIAGDGLEKVTRTVLMSLVVKCQSTMDMINQDQKMSPKQSVELLASLADSLSKAVSSSKRMLPETDRLGTALEVVRRMGAFINEKHPALAGAFLTVLEGFAKELENEFS